MTASELLANLKAHANPANVAGMARYGDRAMVTHVLSQMFEAATHFGMRLPELFCGFPRRAGEPPVGYPVACLPQAWSSGAVFLLLQSCLGITIDGWRHEVVIDRPELPQQLDRMQIRGLAIDGDAVDLCFERIGARTAASVGGTTPARINVLTRL